MESSSDTERNDDKGRNGKRTKKDKKKSKKEESSRWESDSDIEEVDVEKKEKEHTKIMSVILTYCLDNAYPLKCLTIMTVVIALS